MSQTSILLSSNLFLSPQTQFTSVNNHHHRRRTVAFAAVETPTSSRAATSRRRSLYDVLRVNRSASQSEIKSAYRSLAKLYHPDAAAAHEFSDGLDFIAIHNAYATLSDPAARESYDFSIGVVLHRGLATRRWETDQCCCEASISKYNKFLEQSGSLSSEVRSSPKQLNQSLFLKQLAVDLCTSERRILFRTQYILRRRLRDIRSGELKALKIFDGLRKIFKGE